MIGNVIEVLKDSVVLKLNTSDEVKKNIINYHVAFDMDVSTLIGEVTSLNDDKITVALVGEILDSVFVPGISKKPEFGMPCRVINTNELPIIVGNTTDRSVYIGKIAKYNNYQVFARVNDLFNGHFAILGNTGSGKSYGVTRLLQNLFFAEEYPTKSSVFLFDAYGEYNNAFNIEGRNICKVYTTKVSEFEDANTELLRIPLWLLSVDDYTLLLGATKSSQLPIIEKALRLVHIFASNDENIEKYKSNIIAKALIELLYSGGTPSQIRDQIFAVLTTFHTSELSLDSKVVVPGWVRTLRQCLIIDKDGKLPEIKLIGEFFNSFVIDDSQMPIADEDIPYTLEELNNAFDFALISEGILKSNKIYDDNHVLKVRLESLMNASTKEMFNVERYVTRDEYINSLVTRNTGEKVQIIDFNISYVDDRFAKVIVKIVSKMLFEYELDLEDRSSFPAHIILEEAHRYVQNDSDIDVLGYNIFERITKEGRKYGLILGMISQRPSEMSDTAISQCTNFLIFRMQHPRDLLYIREMVPNVTDDIVDRFKVLQPGNCLAFGSAFKLPLTIKLDMPNPKPYSQSLDLSSCWY